MEIADEDDIEQAFQQARTLGLPMVHGEWINTDVFHYYQPMLQVRDWLQLAGFEIVEEGEGDGYHHFIASRD